MAKRALYTVVTIDKNGGKVIHYFDNLDAAESAHWEFLMHPLCENSKFDRVGFTLNKSAQSAIDLFEALAS